MKRLLSVFFILLMCLSFAACTSEGMEGAQTSGQEETSLGDVSSTNEENIYKEINQAFQQLFSEARSKAEEVSSETECIGAGLQMIVLEEVKYEYTDPQGNRYGFSADDRVIDYKNNEASPRYPSGTPMLDTKEKAMDYFKQVFQDIIPEVNQFVETKCTDHETHYEIMLAHNYDTFSDSILLKLNKDGDILYFHVYYGGVTSISAEQNAAFEALLTEYNTQKEFKSCETNVSYKMVAEKLCAAYTITYEYETGTKSVERVVFVQGEVE